MYAAQGMPKTRHGPSQRGKPDQDVLYGGSLAYRRQRSQFCCGSVTLLCWLRTWGSRHAAQSMPFSRWGQGSGSNTSKTMHYQQRRTSASAWRATVPPVALCGRCVVAGSSTSGWAALCRSPSSSRSAARGGRSWLRMQHSSGITLCSKPHWP